MNLFPQLYTNRLKLRKLDIDDLPLLLKYADNKKISDRIINIPHPYREPNAVFRLSYVVQGFKHKSRYVFAIESKAEKHFIGEISLHLLKGNGAELGYWIAEPFWNKGIATEAIGAILKFGFETLELQFIAASCNKDNAASSRVLEKNNFLENGQNASLMYYELNRATYQASDS